MKDSKVMFIVISIILACVVIFTLVHNSKLKRDNDRIQAYFDQTLSALNEIQDSLALIETQDRVIHRIATDPEMGDTTMTNPREQIMESIQNINDYIAQNKERLTNLEQQLNARNIKIKGLQRMIEGLKKTINEKQQMIVEMTHKVDQLQETIMIERQKAAAEIAAREETIEAQAGTISEKEKTISEQSSTISKQEEEINTVYYISAPKKELVTKNFLTKGGLFSSSQKTADYNTDYMTSMNLLNDKEILIKAPIKKVKILSEQNKNSYKLEANGNETVLKITNPNEFRKVKYLIIQED